MDIEPVKKSYNLSAKAEPLAFLLLLVGLVFLVLSTLPFWGAPLFITKQFVLVYVWLGVFLVWLVSKIQTGSFRLPSLFLIAVFALPVLATLISTFASKAIWSAFWGSSFDFSSFVSVLCLFGLFGLSMALVKNQERLKTLFLAIMFSGLVAGGYELLQLIKFSFTFSRGWLPSLPISLIGSWYDSGIFFGFLALISLVWLEMHPFARQDWLKKVLVVVLVLSLILVAIAGFYPVWVMLALGSAFVLVVGILRRRGVDEEAIGILKPSMAVLGLAIFFLIFSTANGLVTKNITALYQYWQLPVTEIRPTFDSTLAVVKGVAQTDLLFGPGPNRFSQAWIAFKPDNINLSVFWDVNFNAAVGTVPTMIIDTGALGAIAWMSFLAVLAYFGLRLWLSVREDKNESKFALVSGVFIGVVYLWVLAWVYNMEVVTMSLTFILSGVLIALVMEEKLIGSKVFKIKKNNLTQLVVFPIIVLPLLLAVSSLYLTSEKLIGSLVFYRSNNLMAQGDLTGGRSALLSAIKYNPNVDAYHRQLAMVELSRLTVLLKNGQADPATIQKDFQTILDSAISAGQQAIAIDPDNYSNYLTLGQIYESLVPLKIPGAYEMALSQYEVARKLNPKNPGVLFNFARLEMASGKNYSARDYLNKSLTQKPNFSSALLILAQMDAQEGKLSEAIKKTSEALSLFPDDIGGFFQLGVYLYQFGDYNQAIMALNRVLDLSPSRLNANAQYFLGQSYAAVGDTVKALEQFESVQKYNPNNQEIARLINNLKSGETPPVDEDEAGDQSVEEEDKDTE